MAPELFESVAIECGLRCGAAAFNVATEAVAEAFPAVPRGGIGEVAVATITRRVAALVLTSADLHYAIGLTAHAETIRRDDAETWSTRDPEGRCPAAPVRQAREPLTAGPGCCR